jgi:hypothetical protein
LGTTSRVVTELLVLLELLPMALVAYTLNVYAVMGLSPFTTITPDDAVDVVALTLPGLLIAV